MRPLTDLTRLIHACAGARLLLHVACVCSCATGCTAEEELGPTVDAATRDAGDCEWLDAQVATNVIGRPVSCEAPPPEPADAAACSDPGDLSRCFNPFFDAGDAGWK